MLLSVRELKSLVFFFARLKLTRNSLLKKVAFPLVLGRIHTSEELLLTRMLELETMWRYSKQIVLHWIILWSLFSLFLGILHNMYLICCFLLAISALVLKKNVNLKSEYMFFHHFAWKIAYIIWLRTLIFACIIFHFNPSPVFNWGNQDEVLCSKR